MNCLAGLGIRNRKKVNPMRTAKKKKETKTNFSYNPLWKLLIDRGLQKQELQQMSDVSPTSIAKNGQM